MKHPFAKPLSLLLAASLLLVPAAAAEDDFDALTSHVDTAVTRELSVTRPGGDLVTTEQNFYLTGGSDPDAPLTLNGSPIGDRGVFGSWGTYVALEPGVNTLDFENGGARQTVTITRRSSLPPAKISSLSSLVPAADVARFSGETVKLSCTGPSGARVSATVGGRKVALSQTASAPEGTPAAFEASVAVPDVSGVRKLGPVTYTLQYGGETASVPSPGALYAAGRGETLLVEMTDASSTLFTESNTGSGFVCTAKLGAVDYVEEVGDTMYRLGSGGWVLHAVARPLTDPGVGWRNQVSSVRFEEVNGEERFVFASSARPIFRASQTDEALTVRFSHTTGIGSVPVKGSLLFSGASVRQEDGDAVVTLRLSGKETLWGYLVEYDAHGNTVLTCKRAPRLASGAKPLKNITVALDPGHGGVDSGAPGIPMTAGPLERDINYATAIAVGKKLEALGASVVFTHAARDENPSLSERILTATGARADFFIALHSNATAVNVNGLKPRGVEVYYYEDIAKPFAEAMLSAMSSRTGRDARWARYSNYKVTLNTLCPAILVEMGYVTNPAEYDSLCSRRGVYNAAQAVADALIAALR